LLEAEAAMRFDDTKTAEQLFSQIAEQAHDDKQAALAQPVWASLPFGG
jgi:hypothetical protein